MSEQTSDRPSKKRKPRTASRPAARPPTDARADDETSPASAELRPTTPSERARTWILSESDVVAAHARIAARHPVTASRVRAARRCLEHADRAMRPRDPGRDGAAPEVALRLYVDAIARLLGALRPEEPLRPLAALLQTQDETTMTAWTTGVTTWAELSIIASETAPLDESVDVEALTALATRGEHAARSLLRLVEAPEHALVSLHARRAVRVAAIGLGVLLLVTAAVTLPTRGRMGADLAAGRRWRASSSAEVCHPERRQCLQTDTGIFFVTREEESPWIEYDLGRQATVSAVDITNRLDCCPDRALPLMVELSTDAASWHEVAHREETFRTWEARFEARQARFVRLRVPRKTTLHLERVLIH